MLDANPCGCSFPQEQVEPGKQIPAALLGAVCKVQALCELGVRSMQATCKLARLDPHMIIATAAKALQRGHPQPYGARCGMREVEKKGLRWGEPQKLTGLSKGDFGAGLELGSSSVVTAGAQLPKNPTGHKGNLRQGEVTVATGSH